MGFVPQANERQANGRRDAFASTAVTRLPELLVELGLGCNDQRGEALRLRDDGSWIPSFSLERTKVRQSALPFSNFALEAEQDVAGAGGDRRECFVAMNGMVVKHEWLDSESTREN